MLKRKILAILTAGIIASGMSLNVTTSAEEIPEVEQVNTLEEEKHDTLLLEEFIKRAEEYFPNGTVEQSENMDWVNCYEALNEAKSVLNNPNTTQIEIDNATDKLSNALWRVVCCYKKQLEACTNKLIRGMAIRWPDIPIDNTCRGMCNTLVGVALNTLDNPNVTKAEIDEVIDVINYAIDNLLF